MAKVQKVAHRMETVCHSMHLSTTFHSQDGGYCHSMHSSTIRCSSLQISPIHFMNSERILPFDAFIQWDAHRCKASNSERILPFDAFIQWDAHRCKASDLTIRCIHPMGCSPLQDLDSNPQPVIQSRHSNHQAISSKSWTDRLFQ
jgi:hypothetical protein